MKTLCRLALIALVSYHAPAQEIIPVRVSNVRLFIDDAEYEWTRSGLVRTTDDETGGDEAAITLKPETIVSFLSFHPEQRSTIGRLEQRCIDSEKRLQDSGYVYEVSILIIPPRRNPEERTVVVEARSGYVWRYGGGNAWGMVGKEGLRGERAAVWGYFGWNRNGLTYLHSRVGGLPLALGGQFYYYGPGDYTSKRFDGIENRFECIATAGWHIVPDLFTGIDIGESGFGFSDRGLFSVQPFVSYQKYLNFGTHSSAGANARVFWYPLMGMSNYEGSIYTHIGITKKLTLAVTGGGGYSGPYQPRGFDNRPQKTLFELYYAEDRSIRSGYTPDELTAPHYLFGSAEFRFNIVTFNIAHTVDCTIQGYSFSDLGGIYDAGGASQKNFVDAYGGGVRVLFDNPVFAYFTFAYGFNHEGKGRFSFCATAGF
jgi:hypothetical protein